MYTKRAVVSMDTLLNVFKTDRLIVEKIIPRLGGNYNGRTLHSNYFLQVHPKETEPESCGEKRLGNSNYHSKTRLEAPQNKWQVYIYDTYFITS